MERIERLPEIVTPVHYRVAVLPIIESNQRLCGHVWIDVVARMTTSIIMLHASPDITVMRALVIPGALNADNSTASQLLGDREKMLAKSLQQRLEQLVAVHRQLLRKFALMELECGEQKKKILLFE